MPGHIPISSLFNQKLADLAQEMVTWEIKPRLDEETEKNIRNNIVEFSHTTQTEKFSMAGVDGSGDYPSLSYADSFVYVATASGTVYRTDTLHGLVEIECLSNPNLELVWLPEGSKKAKDLWLKAFESLSSIPVNQVVEESDYRQLRSLNGGGRMTVDEIIKDLILPPASDTANCGIQLRTMAEWGAALRIIESKHSCRYLIMDTTMSLPFVKNKSGSLFFEHLKRLCCVKGRARGVGVYTLSKSHSLPSLELIESLAQEALGITDGSISEHWYLRLPISDVDDWDIKGIIEDRQIPPIGAVSYLIRLHKNTPLMRLDVDREWWEEHYRNDPLAERKMFEDIDYCGHDQRAYGYPFPVKAGHDRTRISRAERLVLKKQIIDAAVGQGMKRSLFKDASTATGHV